MFSRQTIISNDHNRQSEPVAFLRGPIRPTQVSIRTKFIFAVVKYQRLRGASQNQAFTKMYQWLFN